EGAGSPLRRARAPSFLARALAPLRERGSSPWRLPCEATKALRRAREADRPGSRRALFPGRAAALVLPRSRVPRPGAALRRPWLRARERVRSPPARGLWSRRGAKPQWRARRRDRRDRRPEPAVQRQAERERRVPPRQRARRRTRRRMLTIRAA